MAHSSSFGSKGRWIELVSQLLSAGRHQPLALMVILAALLAQIAYRLSLPYYFQSIFDRVIIQGDASALLGAVLGLSGFLVLFTLAIVLQEWAAPAVAVHISTQLRERLFKKFLRMSGRQHQDHSPAVLVDRMGRTVGDVEVALVRSVPLLLLQASLALISVVLLFSIEWRLALVVVLSLPLTLVLAKPFSRRASVLGKQTDKIRNDVLRLTQESVVGNAVLRLFGLHRFSMGRFQTVLSALAAVMTRGYLFSALSGRSAQVASGITQLLVIGFGGWLVFHGTMTGGLLVAFILLLSNVSAAAGYLGEAIPGILRGSRAMAEIQSILGLSGDVVDPPGALQIAPALCPIRFEGIGFDYTEKPVLRDVSFEIHPGEHIGIVGPSGSGKSTVLLVLSRLETPREGEVWFGEAPLSKIAEESLRGMMTVVPQSSVLFAGTIRDNIVLGVPQAPLEDVQAVVRALALEDMVRALPQGLDTEIGDNGGQLSGGQRQRIALARALLRRTPILVLDEATSALDPMAEHAVLQAIEELAGQSTVISVTHRLASASAFDRILVMEEGRLVQSGTHDQLAAIEGLYQRMWSKVSGFDPQLLETGGAITVELLQSMQLFSLCERVLLEEILPLFLPERLPEGRDVFCQGDPGERFYVVARGSVEVLVALPQQETRSVAVLRDGDFFGEAALLTQSPRNATIRTVTECWFLTLHRQSFLSLLEREPTLRQSISEAIAKRA